MSTNSASSQVPTRRCYGRATFLFGRVLGGVAFVAFLSWHRQFVALVGEVGILPAPERFQRLAAHGRTFLDLPSVFWWIEPSDVAMHTVCVVGELASLALLIGLSPAASALIIALCYRSLVTTGGLFMNYQWDTLLVEVSSIAAIVLPWRFVDRADRLEEPPMVARWLLYLALFRLFFMSGVVKLSSGDAHWSELSALEYHYFTQPLPNPISWFAHQLPSGAHAFAAFTVLVVELVAPWAVVFGVHGRRAAAISLLGLMVIIAFTGNFGFFNLLAAAMCLPLLDDAWLSRIRGPLRMPFRYPPSVKTGSRWEKTTRLGRGGLAVVLIALGLLRLAGTTTVLPEGPLSTIDDHTRPFYIANSYGLFAVMTTSRREIIFEASLDGRTWDAYGFEYKNDSPLADPAFSAPHLPRLEWQLWFAALGEFEDSPWLYSFVRALLENRTMQVRMLRERPLQGRTPRFVRARVREYEFTDWETRFTTGRRWNVGDAQPYGPVFRLEGQRLVAIRGRVQPSVRNE